MPNTPIPELHTLAEVKAMLAEDEYSVDWTREWKQQGRMEMLAAEKALLARRVERRFGANCAATVAVYLEPITDQNRLFDIAEWLVTCPSGEDLLSRFASDA
jgi:xanthine/CO dehydrogenase XdhC/CoxF family maturation factor